MTPALMLIAAQAADPTVDTPPSKAEVCYAQVMMLIEDAMSQTGRVAGPSWFVRDWWDEKLTDAEREDDRQAEVLAAARARAEADPEGSDAEQGECVDEAIEAGAVPGWD